MRLNIVGRQFGRWCVVEFSHVTHNREAYWLCRCSCGVERAVSGSHLRKGVTLSCGCLQLEQSAERLKTHGLTNSPEYTVWQNMKRRCSAHPRYFGRGISICDRWQTFENFYEDMGARPSENHSIDRINNNGNYEPGNCRWATRKEQSLNKEGTLHLKHRGGQVPVKVLSNELGVDYFKLLDALDRLAGHSRRCSSGRGRTSK